MDSAPPHQSFRFMDLPIELRHKIYSYLPPNLGIAFASTSQNVAAARQRARSIITRQYTPRHGGPIQEVKDVPLSLLLTGKAVKQDYWTWFARKPVFVYKGPIDFRQIASFVQCLTPTRGPLRERPKVLKIHFSMTLWDREHLIMPLRKLRFPLMLKFIFHGRQRGDLGEGYRRSSASSSAQSVKDVYDTYWSKRRDRTLDMTHGRNELKCWVESERVACVQVLQNLDIDEDEMEDDAEDESDEENFFGPYAGSSERFEAEYRNDVGMIKDHFVRAEEQEEEMANLYNEDGGHVDAENYGDTDEEDE
ncbi:MAG: hypothetical protein M1820_009180 [Bogoriella megaspora]|nr:MAG: hypothetical protein M1820_009180 [Bogoriella megaspora]